MHLSAEPLNTSLLFIPASRKLLIALFCWLFLLPASVTAREPTAAGLHPYIADGAYGVKIDGKVVRSKALNKKYTPASTIKILTGLMALEILGPQYRFATRFYLDDSSNLYIKGEGDPLLTSETIIAIARELKNRNIVAINQIVLDDTAFSLSGPPPGSANSHNPYDAHSSALAVNFNSLPFRLSANGTVSASEIQTPLLPLMQEISRYTAKGRHRVNVNAYPETKNHSNTLRYCGELFITIFQQQGITVSKEYMIGAVNTASRLILTHESEKTVSEMVRLSLYYSSNFIANQLYLSCGRRVYGFPATWKKASRTAEKFIEIRLHMKPDAITLVDGSGLSTQNKISTAAMLAVLERFAPYADLLKKKGDTYIKSGTLTGVYCYAGYFADGSKLMPFAIFLNQERNTRNKVLKLLHADINSLLDKPRS